MKPSPASGLRTPARRHRRFFLGTVGVFVAAIGSMAFINTWVNPLWVAHAPWTNEKFAEYRQIYRNLRTGKAGLATAQEWTTAMVGSSRVAIAMDPALPQWGDEKVVNLAFSAATLPETSAMVNYLLNHQKHVHHIIVGVDLADLTKNTSSMKGSGFYESPLNDKGDVFERNLRNICGSASLIASLKTIEWRKKNMLPPYTPLGHWLRHRSNAPLRSILSRDSIPQAVRMVRRRSVHHTLAPQKVAVLEALIERALRDKVQLTLVIPPSHAAYLTVYYHSNDIDPGFSIDRRAMIEAVERVQARYPQAPKVVIWDFNDFHPLNAEALPDPADTKGKMHYWVDGTHSLESLGNVMLARIMGWPISDPVEANYGEIIDRSSLDGRLQRIQQSYERYKAEHSADWKWITDRMEAYTVAPGDKKHVDADAE